METIDFLFDQEQEEHPYGWYDTFEDYCRAIDDMEEELRIRGVDIISDLFFL